MSPFLKLASGSSNSTPGLLLQANPRERNMQGNLALRFAIVALCLCLVGSPNAAFAAPRPRAQKSRAAKPASKHRLRLPFTSSADPGKEDIAGYDDPMIRQVALDALGREKGSVVAVDPSNGRILTIVNQKMAFGSGFEPCSTIKPFIALAGLSEGVINRDTMIEVKRRHYMDLTEAMAHSNNNFFEAVGSRLGFERVIKYDSMFGLGQRVGYGIPEEQPGSLPSHPPLFGGVARMSSFGAGIRITPFQLASLVSMLANGGTQYYLQYPRTGEERQNFTPRVRQQFDIQPLIPDIREGMLAAVLYGTAKRSYDPDDGEQALGKTGTCNDEGVGGRLGWFVSYADQANPRIVVVVLLHGGARIITGPHASEIAGRIYHNLYQRNYFIAKNTSPSTTYPNSTGASQ
jgi:penicillin-binding protein 2